MPLQSCYKIENIEAGCDEAGRGCLAGPVFAAAVILPPDYHHKILNDSKQLSEKKRYALRKDIENDALSYAVAKVENEMIDKINILNASFLAMHNALDKLDLNPEYIIIDGNRFKKYKKLPHTCIVKGDSKFFSIAAASILAKTYRDDYMVQLHEKFPDYNWAQNKGYPTKEHRTAIKEFGLTPFHRRSFRLIDTQLKLPFID